MGKTLLVFIGLATVFINVKTIRMGKEMGWDRKEILKRHDRLIKTLGFSDITNNFDILN